MKYEMVEASDAPGEWLIEAINHESEGEITVIRIYGYEARECAKTLVEILNDTPGTVAEMKLPTLPPVAG